MKRLALALALAILAASAVGAALSACGDNDVRGGNALCFARADPCNGVGDASRDVRPDAADASDAADAGAD
jgi:hypothetical protein